MAKKKRVASPDEVHAPAPFVVGTGRCGTTLLRVMLDAHPLLAIPPETKFFCDAALGAKQLQDSSCAVLAAVTGSRNWDKFRVDEETLAEQIAAIQPFDTGEALRTFYRLYAERFDKPRWGDKTPGYLAWMQRIQALLPEAHFIHLVRDGRDVALSVLRLMDRSSSGRRPTVEHGAQWWVDQLKRGRRQAAGIKHYLEIRYEDLVTEPELTLQHVCEFIDLPWDPVMLRSHEGASQRLAADGEKIPELRRLSRPPNTDRVGRWREEMTAEELARVERIAGPLLQKHGYI
jgi:hypothetical protein